MQQPMMKIEHKHELIEKLAGTVFHVTQTDSLESILASGGLLPNLEGSRQSPFENSGNGFFRSMGCVSFFDYRKYGSPEWEEHAHKCMPTLAFRQSRSIAVLFLSESEHTKLIPWSLWKETESWSQRVVPHVEAGYLGEVPLALISKVLLVECSGS